MNPSRPIRILPDLLVKKIAAGEVVERPASVVKELVENSLDAGATRVAIGIEDGGRQLIRVSDDGCGMTADGLRLAVAPHATSKIVAEEDLYAIATLGFRGEALASISAVSKLRIVSRTPEQIEGHEIVVVAEKVESAGAAGCPPGTTIEVRDLFFNVPARRKFLRATATEVGHIHDQVARLALPHHGITFELTNNGRVSQNLPACDDRLKRIGAFYGPELAAALLTVQRNERGIELEIYAAPPAQSRATNQWQYTFVNGRWVRDRFLQHAIKEAYRGLMEPNRHGLVFVFIRIDPREVDVNVHPTKAELRWADPNLIHSQVLSALRETFQRAELSPALRTGRVPEPVDPAEQERLRREFAEIMKATDPLRRGHEALRGGHEPVPGGGEALRGVVGNVTDAWRNLYRPPEPDTLAVAGGPLQPGLEAGDRMAMRPDATGGDPLRGGGDLGPGRTRAVQMHNLYLVAETEDGIVIVDQHALHERILYEKLRDRMTQGALESQRLLLPETLKVTPEQAALLEANGGLLERLGMEIGAFGQDAIAVHAFPALLKDTDVVTFMRDLIDFLGQQSGATKAEVIIDRVLSMMACKAAVKAGDPLTTEEIESLFAQRHLVEKPSSCPHGRPTMLRLTKADLDRQFHRT